MQLLWELLYYNLIGFDVVIHVQCTYVYCTVHTSTVSGFPWLLYSSVFTTKSLSLVIPNVLMVNIFTCDLLFFYWFESPSVVLDIYSHLLFFFPEYAACIDNIQGEILVKFLTIQDEEVTFRPRFRRITSCQTCGLWGQQTCITWQCG